MDNIVEHLIKMTKDKDMNFELYKTGVRKVRTGFARLKDDLNLSNKSYFLDITKLECKDFTDKSLKQRNLVIEKAIKEAEANAEEDFDYLDNLHET